MSPVPRCAGGWYGERWTQMEWKSEWRVCWFPPGLADLLPLHVVQGLMGYHVRMVFPKGPEAPSEIPSFRFFGHRHNWEYAIVWLDNPAVQNQTLLGVSMPAASRYGEQVPVDEKYLERNRVKLEYYNGLVLATTALRLTETTGESQDLIQWDQLPGVARDTLSDTDWDTTLFDLIGAKIPLKDENFNKTLEAAFPVAFDGDKDQKGLIEPE